MPTNPLEGLGLPPDLEHIDQVSREQWSRVIAKSFQVAWPVDVLRMIVAHGEQKFIAKARIALAKQDLRKGDYAAIFHQLRLAAGPGPWQNGIKPTFVEDRVH